MRIGGVLSCLVAGLLTSFVSQATAITVQTGSDVFNTRPFLWVEAEDYSALVDGGAANDGWKVVSKETPITSVGNVPLPILPANSNVSGTALLDDIGGGHHEDTATYEVQFMTAATYQIYLRHSMYDSADADSAYGNEDSIFMSPAFNKNSASDWIGFEGLDFDESDLNVEVPIPGFAHDPDGFKPSTGDSAGDGWTAIRDWGVKSAGVVTFPNNAANADWNGNFNWYNRPSFIGTNPAGGFTSDSGFKMEYIVTEEMVGETLTFEIGNREHYGVIDGFLFIEVNGLFIAEGDQYPKNDLLDIYTQADLDAGILPQANVADYNGDGTVNAADYAVWRDGGSPDDTQAGYDLWKANFGNSGSGSGSAVPEPASVGLLLVGLGMLVVRFRR
ncbi:MAG: PEP-CTERM sorting domain-containing protein [Pirellulales bacterium]